MDRGENLGPALRPRSARAATIRRFGEVDWDFPDQLSESPFSDIHWHPCRFPSQIPAIVIGRMTGPGDAVLDPFVGSGTTLVEAQRMGRPSTGIDINPVSCLLTRAKTLAIPAREIVAYIASAKTKLLSRWNTLKRRDAPPTVQMKKWYTPATQVSLERLWNYVTTSPAPLNIVLQAAFSAVLMPACRETRHWGYVCDNSEPKGDRERDVRDLFCDILERFGRAYTARELHNSSSLSPCAVIQGDANQVLSKMPDQSFACFVTSPPYFGVADYVKSQRLSMEWFGLEIEPARRLEIGARSKRHRRTAVEEYIEEISSVFEQVFRVLRRGGWGLVIYGQSSSRASAREILNERWRSIGFRLELQKNRQIREMRRQFPSLRDEQVLIMRKA